MQCFLLAVLSKQNLIKFSTPIVLPVLAYFLDIALSVTKHKRSWESKPSVQTFSVFVFLLQHLPAHPHFQCSTLLHHCQYLILLFVLHFLPCWSPFFAMHYTLIPLSLSFTEGQQAAYSNLLQIPRDRTKVSLTAAKQVSTYAQRTTEVSTLITMGFYQWKKLLWKLWLHTPPFYWSCSSCSQVQLKKSNHAFTWESSSLLTSQSQLCQGLAQGAMNSCGQGTFQQQQIRERSRNPHTHFPHGCWKPFWYKNGFMHAQYELSVWRHYRRSSPLQKHSSKQRQNSSYYLGR